MHCVPFHGLLTLRVFHNDQLAAVFNAQRECIVFSLSCSIDSSPTWERDRLSDLPHSGISRFLEVRTREAVGRHNEGLPDDKVQSFESLALETPPAYCRRL